MVPPGPSFPHLTAGTGTTTRRPPTGRSQLVPPGPSFPHLIASRSPTQLRLASPARTHARTKRNDFPVGLTPPTSNPQPPIKKMGAEIWNLLSRDRVKVGASAPTFTSSLYILVCPRAYTIHFWTIHFGSRSSEHQQPDPSVYNAVIKRRRRRRRRKRRRCAQCAYAFGSRKAGSSGTDTGLFCAGSR